ncbi:MAG TPA: DUF362 domain-containing protein [Halanaerobiales bacterium]|nr:DUF362 domain-containing protein [Halanaerobiales bacterium]
MKHEIHIIYGDQAIKMTRALLTNLNLEQKLDREMLIGIKPNLVLDKPSDSGATTSPEIIEGLIQYLQEYGFKKIVIMESSWVGGNTDASYQVCGYEKLENKYNVPLLDLKEEETVELNIEGMNIRVCKPVLDVDFLINVPVLKAHCQTKFTCALKNLKGCIPDSEKRRFHTLGLHKPIAYLGKIISSDLVIVDAIIGDLTFEEGGNPVKMDRIIAGEDSLLIDIYGAELIGYSKEDIKYLQIAEELSIGEGKLENAEIYEYNTGQKSSYDFKHSRKIERLANKIIAKNACSACYGSLIHALQRLSDLGQFDKIQKVCIGQGYKGKKGETGVGSCTSRFNYSLKGCPPSARDIIKFLENVNK